MIRILWVTQGKEVVTSFLLSKKLVCLLNYCSLITDFVFTSSSGMCVQETSSARTICPPLVTFGTQLGFKALLEDQNLCPWAHSERFKTHTQIPHALRSFASCLPKQKHVETTRTLMPYLSLHWTCWQVSLMILFLFTSPFEVVFKAHFCLRYLSINTSETAGMLKYGVTYSILVAAPLRVNKPSKFSSTSCSTQLICTHLAASNTNAPSTCLTL